MKLLRGAPIGPREVRPEDMLRSGEARLPWNLSQLKASDCPILNAIHGFMRAEA